MTTVPTRCVLLGVQLPGQTSEDFATHMAELGRLVDTLGYDIVATITQRRSGRTANVVGAGKLKELAHYTGGTGVVYRGPQDKKDDDDDIPDGLPEVDDDGELVVLPDVAPDHFAELVAVDIDLTPSQLRNLGMATSAEVLDRTGVILEIFHRHARSREARLQVEIARLNYAAPRIREFQGGSERKRGGIGGKGTGESEVELNRRRIRDRIAELRRELEQVEAERLVRRERRRDQFRVALVGYTNAGKSSLMRALTAGEHYVADKLFATLDTTVRALQPETHPKILVSDTVGFIRKLPHDLVACFRSTLDEASEASLLLHVVDASDPGFRDQYNVTREVLGEIGAGDVASRLVLNKCDRLDDDAKQALRDEYPEAWLVSAHQPESVAWLHEQIRAHLHGVLPEAEIFVPWSHSRLIGEIRAHAEVVTEAHEDDGTRYVLRAPQSVLDRLLSALKQG